MASPPIAPSSTSARREWAILHLSFILIGVITTLLGPILPYFSHTWSLTDAQAGFFFTSQYFFSTLGVILTSVFLPRFGFARVSAAGFVAFVIGFAFLGLSPWIVSVFMVGINGFGYGLTNPSINLRATQLPSKNTAAAVTFLNFSWSIGAVLCPFLVAALVPSSACAGILRNHRRLRRATGIGPPISAHYHRDGASRARHLSFGSLARASSFASGCSLAFSFYALRWR